MKNWVKWSTQITPRVVLLRLCPIASRSGYEKNPQQCNCHRRHFIEVIKVTRWRKNQYEGAATDRRAAVRRHIRQGDLGERVTFDKQRGPVLNVYQGRLGCPRTVPN